MINIKKDGHIHSPFCPHGTKDSLEMYVEKALEEGLGEITFTEHLPLPKGFIDENIIDESAPDEENFALYIEEVKRIKEKYKDKIKILIGAEIDYLEGLEEETAKILEKFKDDFEDSIISVHFIKYKDKYYCLDYSTERYEELINITGSLENLYNLYYETVIKSINADLNGFKAKRVGHPALVRIFNIVYPYNYKNEEMLKRVALEIQKGGYSVDYNTAGVRKKYCGEVYPSGILNELIDKYGIEKIYGSDSHTAKDVGFGFGTL
ncbi:MAG: histidinol-phosphatase HisJ [Clostridium sp.]|nr:histidinol-phosphatase HisJ [Clostridium sp.]